MIEVVITIAVIAILAAVLVPLISQNIQSARMSRAASEVSAIGKAIVQFRQDTDKWPIFAGATQYRLLFAAVDSDFNGVPEGSSIPSTWSAIPAANRLSLAYHLMSNNSGLSGGPSKEGLPCWNGPYLTDIKVDPWGNPYLVNAEWLWTGNTGTVYVLSSGPGRPAQVETPFNGNPPAGSDDITYRIK